MSIIEKLKLIKANKRQLKDRVKKSPVESEKNQLNNQIDQLEIEQKQEEIRKINQEKQENIKNELKERYIYLNNKAYLTLKKIGLIESKRDLSKLLNKNPTFLTTIEAKKQLPKIETINDLSQIISDIIGSIDCLLIGCEIDVINKDSILRVLKQVQSGFSDLKRDLIVKLYNI